LPNVRRYAVKNYLWSMSNDKCNQKECILEKMDVHWINGLDGERLMPYILGTSVDDDTMYRVNYCPLCGEYVRDIIVKKEG